MDRFKENKSNDPSIDCKRRTRIKLNAENINLMCLRHFSEKSDKLDDVEDELSNEVEP